MNNGANKPVLDPIVQKFIDKLAKAGGAPIYKLKVEEARKLLSDLQSESVQKLPADIEDRTIPTGPNGSIDIRIIRPKGNTEILPVIIYIHGAGWILGGKDTHDRLMREIANGAKAAVVFVDYKRAPEAPYPSIHEEGYASAKWILENGRELKLDTSRMAISGDSVGGLVATAIAMMAQERGGPKFIFQALFYPVTDANFETPSYKQFAEGYFLERDGMKWFWDAYVPNKSMREHPLVSPLKASLEQLKNLPSTLTINGECDVLRDEGEAYSHKLMQAGVKVVAVRYLGMIHDFLMLNSITSAPAVREAIAQANQMFRDAFKKS